MEEKSLKIKMLEVLSSECDKNLVSKMIIFKIACCTEVCTKRGKLHMHTM
jgi:hypothetical protein